MYVTNNDSEQISVIHVLKGYTIWFSTKLIQKAYYPTNIVIIYLTWIYIKKDLIDFKI